MSYTITTPDTTPDRDLGYTLVQRATALTIFDAPSLDVAAAFLRDCATAKKSVEAKLAPAVDAAHKAHKALTALRSDLCAPFDKARAVVEPKVLEFQRAEAARREEERRAAEAAAKKAAEEAQLAAALDAAEAGHDDAAEAILEEKPLVVAFAPPPAPKVDGVTERVTYSAKVVDFAALVASGRLELLLPNQSALDGLARALKGAMNIPGVEVVTTKTLSVRSK